MKRNVILLLIASIVIYGVQLIVFHDPNTTAFYILQDVAFLPISIAVATIVVGEYLSEKEKKDRQEKTQMLCSGFFTEMGNELLQVLLPLSKEKADIKNLFETVEVNDGKSLDELREKINKMPIRIELNEAAYKKIEKMITESRDLLLIFSSNPLLIDHADFTKMLWALFHLVDEFRLRGPYESLSVADMGHIESDFAEILKLVLINWSRNRLFTKKQYPNYFNSSVGTMFGE